MKSVEDQIIDLLREKGEDLRQADLQEIETLLLDVDLDELAIVRGHVWEAIALVVNDPSYVGDIEPVE